MRGSIFRQKHKDGSISYGIVYDDHSAPKAKRRQRRIRGFRTRKDADNKLLEIRAAVQRCGHYYEPTRLSVREYGEKWLAEVERTVRPRTIVGYRERLQDYVIRRIGHMPMWAVQPQHLKDLYEALLLDGRKRKPRAGTKTPGLRPRSVLHVHRVLHAMFAEAVRTSVVASNPCASVKPPRVPRTEQRVLSQREVSQLVRAANGNDLYPLVVLALSTGARVGELAALLWRFVDLDLGQITIAYGQAKDGSLAEPKTHRSRRSIKLPPAAISMLTVLKAKQKLAAGGEWTEDQFVLTDSDRNPWLVAGLSRRFREIVTKAGLGFDVHPHVLRHTYASLALKGGVPVTTVSAHLGHSSMATTMNVYAHHIPAAEDAAASIMQRALEGAT